MRRFAVTFMFILLSLTGQDVSKPKRMLLKNLKKEYWYQPK